MFRTWESLRHHLPLCIATTALSSTLPPQQSARHCLHRPSATPHTRRSVHFAILSALTFFLVCTHWPCMQRATHFARAMATISNARFLSAPCNAATAREVAGHSLRQPGSFPVSLRSSFLTKRFTPASCQVASKDIGRCVPAAILLHGSSHMELRILNPVSFLNYLKYHGADDASAARCRTSV